MAVSLSQEPSQNTIGSKVAMDEWETDVTTVLWVVRWTARGLMPIRPQVHLKVSAVLSTGRALELLK